MTRDYIFIVEDYDDDFDLIVRSLREKARLKNEIVRARDGEEAQAMLLGEPPTEELPRLILLDINLPRLDGIELLEILKSNPRTELIPVVVLTGSSDQEKRNAAWRASANSFIRKPLSAAEFMEVVRELGLYWCLVNEVPWGI